MSGLGIGRNGHPARSINARPLMLRRPRESRVALSPARAACQSLHARTLCQNLVLARPISSVLPRECGREVAQLAQVQRNFFLHVALKQKLCICARQQASDACRRDWTPTVIIIKWLSARGCGMSGAGLVCRRRAGRCSRISVTSFQSISLSRGAMVQAGAPARARASGVLSVSMTSCPTERRSILSIRRMANGLSIAAPARAAGTRHNFRGGGSCVL